MEILTKDHIDKLPLFTGIDYDTLSPLLKKCGVTDFKKGEFIYRSGEYGDDCGIIISGVMKVDFRKGAISDKAAQHIILKQGDIFGEIAALSGYARTADVSVEEPAKLLVIPKAVLLKLFDKFDTFKSRIDSFYRKRVLKFQLQSTPLFMGLPEELIQQLAEKSTLHSYDQEDVVFQQGDDADAFYLVRYGFIKVTETGQDGIPRVMAYLKGGHFFGEMALVHDGEKRMATITAIDRTELVRISREDFEQIIESYPRVKASLGKAIEKTLEKNIRIREDVHLEKTLSSAIDSGFVRSKEVLVIDFTKCIQCNSCIQACSTLYGGQSRLTRKGVRLNNILLIATSCRHCDNPTCMIKCPTGAINRGAAGEIYYNDACIGCGQCARNCAYGNITMIEAATAENSNKGFVKRFLKKTDSHNSEADEGTERKRRPKKKPVKCDMCREYPFMACVYNCPTGAAQRIDPADFVSDIVGTA